MPEGDTIFRTATTLAKVLEGRRVVRFAAPRLPRHRPVAGATVEVVEPRGKHLLVRFDNGLTLHTHMRMTGSWHVYRRGERWRKPPWLARAVVEVDDAVAVCFSAPVVELLEAPEVARHGALTMLGPDLCRDGADLEEALRRLESHDGREIGDVLLDQRVACGVGNVYKSETLFACGVDPFAAVRDLRPDVRRHLLATASELLRQNLHAPGARTTYEGRLAVYGRTRRPCLRCGTLIVSRRQGEDARMTYWCPRCQIRP